jgi:hypothetical protein
MNTSLIIGIESGILTSAILFLCARVLRNVVVPWYQSMIYEGIEIDGDWNIEINGARSNSTCEIDQHAHRIKGHIKLYQITDAADDIDLSSVYSLEGRFSSPFANFIIRHTNRRRLGAGNCLLQVSENGKEMIGFLTIYKGEPGSIIAIPCKFVRPR